MALEPRTITLGAERIELVDMTRRFWVSVVVASGFPAGHGDVLPLAL
jgi:hypothetical protein